LHGGNLPSAQAADKEPMTYREQQSAREFRTDGTPWYAVAPAEN